MKKDLAGSPINKRAVPVSGTVIDLIEAAFSDLEGLRDECQEIVDNASEGLSQTQRMQTFEETVDALSFVDSVPDVPEEVQDLLVRFTEDQRKSKSHSRATRCCEAINLLACTVEVLNEFVNAQEQEDKNELVEKVEQLISELEDAISYAEGAEFPGMYG